MKCGDVASRPFRLAAVGPQIVSVPHDAGQQIERSGTLESVVTFCNTVLLLFVLHFDVVIFHIFLLN